MDHLALRTPSLGVAANQGQSHAKVRTQAKNLQPPETTKSIHGGSGDRCLGSWCTKIHQLPFSSGFGPKNFDGAVAQSAPSSAGRASRGPPIRQQLPAPALLPAPTAPTSHFTCGIDDSLPPTAWSPVMVGSGGGGQD